VDVRTVLQPAWTTDWISEDGGARSPSTHRPPEPAPGIE